MTKQIHFSSSFTFGIGDADLQVIGEDFTRTQEHAEQTMWDYFAKTSGKVLGNTPPGKAIDRFHHWREDIALMQDLGVTSYRTSVSIARILSRDGSPNEAALNWYKTYFQALKKAGIHISVTLYHWELPQFVSATGGWKKRSIVELLLKHTDVVYTYLGEYIDAYFLINEPRHVSFRSYHEGIQAPGETNLRGALLAAHHILLAQGRIVQKLKKYNKNIPISTVLNMSPCYPATNETNDVAATRIADKHRNGWFGDPIYFGTYPQEMTKLFGQAMPSVTPADMKIIQIGDQLTAMGINYYKGVFIKYDPKNPLSYALAEAPTGEKNDLGWPIFVPPQLPAGLFDIVTQMYSQYKDAGLKEIYIAENGTALSSNWDHKTPLIDDSKRITYLTEHLIQLHQAIQSGVPITKYFLWTLMDNYEWTQAYSQKSAFGIVYVDQKTLKRIPKKSFTWYKQLVRTHQLEL